MAASQENINATTPMGANLIAGGATFRVWAPRARHVFVLGDFIGWTPRDEGLLTPDSHGYWAGFIPGARHGQAYKFHVAGEGSEGPKRDPYARELSTTPDYPRSNCLLRSPNHYPWHDSNYRSPPFHELVIYQLHIGTFPGLPRTGRFLDVIDRLDYLVQLGINAIEPLPVVEFPHSISLGYNGVDYFSPEMAYAVPPAEIEPYLTRINTRLSQFEAEPLRIEHITSDVGQLKAMIDLCHLYGISVIFDVVYNHAGGDFGGGPKESESLYFFDRFRDSNNNNSLYFTSQGWAGGLIFAYWNADVRQFLINNALHWLDEYHIDGFRYDEVTVIDRFGGWTFCQDLTRTVRYRKPEAVQIAEFWKDDQSWVLKPVSEQGAEFDIVWHDRLRDSIREAIRQSSGGQSAEVDLDRVAAALHPPFGDSNSWRAVNYIENHDFLWVNHEPHEWKPRIASLADPSNPRSWYARSRSRVATGLLLTAPGIPMLFMGQEFLESRFWADDPLNREHQLDWAVLVTDRAMGDHFRFTRELISLRRSQPAFTRGRVNVFHVHRENRVLAFHRWIEGEGRDVVVVASLNESTWNGYEIGFPAAGHWTERFNSDVYDHWVNPAVAGNAGGIEAHGAARHGMPHSARITIPANSILVFTRD
jgi:1,4-alpha-glucan branching enzyme